MLDRSSRRRGPESRRSRPSSNSPGFSVPVTTWPDGIDKQVPGRPRLSREGHLCVHPPVSPSSGSSGVGYGRCSAPRPNSRRGIDRLTASLLGRVYVRFSGRPPQRKGTTPSNQLGEGGRRRPITPAKAGPRNAPHPGETARRCWDRRATGPSSPREQPYQTRVKGTAIAALFVSFQYFITY